MLSIRNLTKIYTTKKGLTTGALNNVSANFGNSGLVFILGKSGSGKSTLLNLLGGLDNPTSGEIIVNGKSSESFSESDFDGYRNTYVGFVFQEYNLIDNYSVGANIGLALELQGLKAEANLIDDLLRKVDLVHRGETLADRRVTELSGGQRQRVAIARALIKNPEIILADEPTGALDSTTGAQFYELLKSLSEEKLIIVVSHDRDSAEKYGDRIIELQDGIILSDSAPVQVDSASESNLTTENQRDFIKSKLPFKRSFTLGAGALKTKPIRLVFSLVLMVFAFALLGFSMTAASVDRVSAELTTLHENKQTFVTINGCALDSAGKYSSDKTLSSSQLDTIKRFNDGKEPIVVYDSGQVDFNMWKYHGSEHFVSYDNQYQNLFYSMFNFAELDPVTGAEDAGLTPDARLSDKTLCRLPQNAQEIAITDICADAFMMRGYRAELSDETSIKINSPDELIGKKLGDLTICGVYSTEVDAASLREFKGFRDREFVDRIFSGIRASYATYSFVCKGFNSGYNVTSSVLIKLSNDLGKNESLMDELTYKIGRSTYASAFIKSTYSGFTQELSFFYSDVFLLIVSIVIVLFSIFAILLTMNFISVSIEFQRKKYGILRALGAGKGDLLKICLSESLIIAGAAFILSLIAAIVACVFANSFLFLSVFNIGFGQIALMLLLSLGVTALAAALPLIRLMKKKPVDIINIKK